MTKTQFILQYPGTVTINYEYTVTIASGQALLINWFPDNDLIVQIDDKTHRYNTNNTQKIDDHTYLIKIVKVENLYNLPIKFQHDPYIVADNIVINQKNKEYFTADQIDIFPDELVAAHGNKVTRVLFAGNKTATEHYIKK